MKKKMYLCSLLLLMLIALVACGAPLSSIKLDQEQYNLKEECLQLNATTEPADADKTKFIWSTSDDKVAKVDQTGLVTGVSLGTATITVKSEDGKLESKCELKVLIAGSAVNVGNIKKVSINIGKDAENGGFRNKAGTVYVEIDTNANKIRKVEVNASETDGFASDEAIATYVASSYVGKTIPASKKFKVVASPLADDEVGKVTSGATVTSRAIVNAINFAIGCSSSTSPVALNKDSYIWTKGVSANTLQLEATYDSSVKIAWRSNNTEIATVSQTGLVSFTGTKGGNVEISAIITTDIKKKAICRITVNIPATSVSLDRKSTEAMPFVSIMVGGKDQLKSYLEPIYTTDDVEWSSSDTSVITFKTAKPMPGLIEGLKVGEAIVTVKVKGTNIKQDLKYKVFALNQKDEVSLNEIKRCSPADMQFSSFVSVNSNYTEDPNDAEASLIRGHAVSADGSTVAVAIAGKGVHSTGDFMNAIVYINRNTNKVTKFTIATHREYNNTSNGGAGALEPVNLAQYEGIELCPGINIYGTSSDELKRAADNKNGVGAINTSLDKVIWGKDAQGNDITTRCTQTSQRLGMALTNMAAYYFNVINPTITEKVKLSFNTDGEYTIDLTNNSEIVKATIKLDSSKRIIDITFDKADGAFVTALKAVADELKQAPLGTFTQVGDFNNGGALQVKLGRLPYPVKSDSTDTSKLAIKTSAAFEKQESQLIFALNNALSLADGRSGKATAVYVSDSFDCHGHGSALGTGSDTHELVGTFIGFYGKTGAFQAEVTIKDLYIKKVVISKNANNTATIDDLAKLQAWVDSIYVGLPANAGRKLVIDQNTTTMPDLSKIQDELFAEIKVPTAGNTDALGQENCQTLNNVINAAAGYVYYKTPINTYKDTVENTDGTVTINMTINPSVIHHTGGFARSQGALAVTINTTSNKITKMVVTHGETPDYAPDDLIQAYVLSFVGKTAAPGTRYKVINDNPNPSGPNEVPTLKSNATQTSEGIVNALNTAIEYFGIYKNK